MMPLVTIAIPIYKRLSCLPGALRSIAAQDYPHIELIVSDNGLNGTVVRDLVAQHYTRPYVFRQNVATVPIPVHHKQLVQAAAGKYFIWMPDDDTMNPNYVSELVPLLEQDPQIAVAMARHEYVDSSRCVLRTSPNRAPHCMSGEQFILKWTRMGYESYTPILARTSEIRACGGYLEECRGGTHVDDALLVKLVLGRSVAFTNSCSYQVQQDDESVGWSLKMEILADDTRKMLWFLDSDPWVLAYAKQEPVQWSAMKHSLVTMTWETYYSRWDTLYKKRLSLVPWIRAAFALPYIPSYYRAVRSSLWYGVKEKLLSNAKAQFPGVYRLCQAIRGRMS
jgi:glycosyltransferase involved in cell wall biosynthesis